ncbi:MAG: class I SAM-dependent methyltransferase [Planctomycetota bacterium]
MAQPVRRQPDLGTEARVPPWQLEWWRVPFLHEEAEDAGGATISRFELPERPMHKVALPRDATALHTGERLDPDANRWPRTPLLASRATPWLAELDDLYAAPGTYPTSVAPEAGLLLHALAANIRPATVFELGVGFGVSTIWIASALGNDARHVGIDDFTPIGPEPGGDRLDAVRTRLERAGVGTRVRLVEGHTSHAAKALHAELRDSGGVQLAVIDADHTVRGCWHDLWAVEPVLAPGGYAILHDTNPQAAGCDGPRAVLDWLDALAVGLYERVELPLAPVDMGLAVLRRIG